MGKNYTLKMNLDRDTTCFDFEEGQPPIGAILQIEYELVWRDQTGCYSRGINGTPRDRYFKGMPASWVGMALIEWQDEKDEE